MVPCRQLSGRKWTIFIFSELTEHDPCHLKNAKNATFGPRKTAQSAKTALNHMKTLT
jgi:hypothetical protein